MGLDIMFTGTDPDEGRFRDGPFSLASATGWNLVSKWVDGLAGKYPKLRALCERGRAKDTVRLAAELTQALRESPPKNPAVRKTLKAFRKLLGIGDRDETATVTE